MFYKQFQGFYVEINMLICIGWLDGRRKGGRKGGT